MAIKLSQIKAKTKKATVKHEEYGEMAIEYRPSALTAETQVTVMRMMTITEGGAGEAPEIMGDYLGAMERLVASWDLLGEDGKPLAITKATLRQDVPMDLVGAIFRTIMEDMRPNEASARD